jgi:hypothetical protein
MRYPSRIDDIFNAVAYASQVQDRLFDGEKDRVLVYDKAYRTKSIVTCLRYGDLMLKNYALQSPYGEEYEIDGLAVIKYNDIETLVEVQENLRMRESPDINAAAVTLHAITRDDFGRQILTDNARRNVVETGERFSYDQKTVKEDTIDGITAPWYHIIVPISDDFSSAVWVFGGYLKVYR